MIYTHSLGLAAGYIGDEAIDAVLHSRRELFYSDDPVGC
jgi:hypothetical protein